MQCRQPTNILCQGSSTRSCGSQLGEHAHLVERFHEEVGIGPKAVARMVRFNRALTLARTEKDPDWADIAALCGYADQAHLIRDFRALAGETPAAWQWRAV